MTIGRFPRSKLLSPKPNLTVFGQIAKVQQFVSPQDQELYASGEIRLPTLMQALELAQRFDMMVNIELKMLPRMYPGLADAVVNLIEAMGLECRILISSFDHEQLVRVRQCTNIIATGVLTSDRLANPGAYLHLLDADAYNPGCYAIPSPKSINLQGLL
jgi:glycerophosphoryl diester phosphodiesterase